MAQFASDLFEGVEDTELSAYNAAWTKAPGTTGSMEIASGRLRPSTTVSPGYYHSGVPASADYSVSANCYKFGATTSNSVAVNGRQSTSANTLYRAAIYRSSTSQCTVALHKFVAGTATQLGSNISVAHADGATLNLKLEMVGTAIKLYHAGAETPSISVTDSSITDAGRAGVRAYSADAPSDTIGVHLADFSADDIGGSGTTPVTLTSSLAAAIQQGRSATSALSAALQVNRTGTASADAAIQLGRVLQPSADAAIRVNRSHTGSLGAAIRQSRAAAASLDALIEQAGQRTEQASLGAAILHQPAATASLGAAVRQQRAATASASAAISRAFAVSASLDGAVRQAAQAQAGLGAYIEVAGAALLTVSASAAIRAAHAHSGSLSAAIRQARSAVAGLDVAIAAHYSAGASVSGYIHEGSTLTAGVDAAVRSARALSASLSAFVATGADPFIGNRLYAVPPENRIYTVARENRIYTVKDSP
jgi:hypothetical protein